MNEAPNPYQSAVSSDAEPARKKPYAITAASRPWAVLAVLLVVTRFFVRGLFARFDTEVPAITALLLRLYTPIFFFAVGVAFLAIAGLMRSEAARRRVGFISLVLACCVGLVAGVLGYLLPCLSLWQNMR